MQLNTVAITVTMAVVIFGNPFFANSRLPKRHSERDGGEVQLQIGGIRDDSIGNVASRSTGPSMSA